MIDLTHEVKAIDVLISYFQYSTTRTLYDDFPIKELTNEIRGELMNSFIDQTRK